MFTKSLQWIRAAAVGAILFATGYLVGLQQNGADLTKAYANGVARGAGALETLWGEDTGTITDETDGEIDLIVGQITSISKNELQITTDGAKSPITVVTTGETAFFIRNQKDAAQVSREQATYQAAVNKNPQLSIAPLPTFTEETATADILRTGDFVEISTTSDAGSDAILAVRVVRTTSAPTTGQ